MQLLCLWIGLCITVHWAQAFRSGPVEVIAPLTRPSDESRTCAPRPHVHMRADATTGNVGTSARTVPDQDMIKYPLWPALPIAPYGTRKTEIQEVVPGQVWTFDQLQGILYVIVPVRMTVVKLQAGGLFVYAPVAPTKEVMEAMRQLEAEHGEVKYVVLPTLAVEHKVFAGVFARQFKNCQAYVMPGQYSFPLPLPLSALGFGGKKYQDLPPTSKGMPWEGELDHLLLGPFKSRNQIGAYGEAAFYHKASRTLLVTDIIVQVEPKVPKILDAEPRALLFHARDGPLEFVPDTPQVRAKGWRRIVQFGLFFNPSAIEIIDFGKAFQLAAKSPMKQLGWGGLFPFKWVENDVPSFRALEGGVFVAPILTTLILNRNPDEVLDWADAVARWPFQRIVPCHLANNIKTTPKAFRNAFSFLEKRDPSPKKSFLELFFPRRGSGGQPSPLPDDLGFLNNAEKNLVKIKTLYDASEPVERRPGRPKDQKGKTSKGGGI